MEEARGGDLLFEIGTEELPAGYIPEALSRYEDVLSRNLGSARLGFSGMRVYGTPRRLVFVVSGLPSGQADQTVEVRGPRVEAAYDAGGNPTKTLKGFARAQGVDMEKIIRVKTKKGEVVAARKTVRGGKTADLLPAILEKTMAAEVFPKSMRWGSSSVSFARPVRSLLAIFKGSGLDVSFGPVRSPPLPLGHGIQSDHHPVRVSGPAS